MGKYDGSFSYQNRLINKYFFMTKDIIDKSGINENDKQDLIQIIGEQITEMVYQTAINEKDFMIDKKITVLLDIKVNYVIFSTIADYYEKYETLIEDYYKNKELNNSMR